jgi:hypothetical protein
MVKGAFRDITVTHSARNKVKEFTGDGLAFVQFRIEFEALCRKAEIDIHNKAASSLVAEFFRSALTASNMRTLKATPVPGTEYCCDPSDLTLEEMYKILEPRWYVQHPKKDTNARGTKPVPIAVRATPIEKIASALWIYLPFQHPLRLPWTFSPRWRRREEPES